MADVIPKWCSRYLDESSLAAVQSAVRAVESKSEVEIVPVIARSSRLEMDGPKVLALATLALGFFPPEFSRILALLSSEGLAIGVVVGFSLMVFCLFTYIAPLRRLTTSRFHRGRDVGLRAQMEFYRLGLSSTSGRTGILLFLSLDERQAVVLADKTIAEKTTPETWTEVVALIINGAKSGRLADGLVAAITECGKISAELFPLNNVIGKNELRNELRFVD